MSITGLALRPGTDVLPMCSSWIGSPAHARSIRPASASYSRGQSGSYGTTNTLFGGVAHDGEQLGAGHVKHHLQLAGVEPHAVACPTDLDVDVVELALLELRAAARTNETRLRL